MSKYAPEQIQQNLQVIRWLAEKYPNTFFTEQSKIRPLQHKITGQILSAYPSLPQAEQKILHRAIGMYRHQAAYQIAVALGKRRRDLIGHKVEQVYEAERERARAWCIENKAWTDALEKSFCRRDLPQPKAVD